MPGHVARSCRSLDAFRCLVVWLSANTSTRSSISRKHLNPSSSRYNGNHDSQYRSFEASPGSQSVEKGNAHWSIPGVGYAGDYRSDPNNAAAHHQAQFGERNSTNNQSTHTTMTKQEIIDKLKLTRKHMDELREEQFDYSKIVAAFEFENNCGTVCCVLGWYPKWYPCRCSTGVVQSIRNRQVSGSNPLIGSKQEKPQP